MGNPPPLRVDTPSLTWDPADVTVPPVPLIPAGLDPMSLMISAYMPGLAAPLISAVADTHAREERLAANLAGARSSYQSTDDAGEHEIQAVSSQELAAADPAMAGSADAASSSGQLMNTAMQIGSQAAQAPTQMMGMVASAPQGVMQQVGQLSGQFEKSGGRNDANENDAVASTAEPREPEKDEDDAAVETTASGASPSSTSTERAPATEPGLLEATTPQTPPRVHQTDGFDSIEP